MGICEKTICRHYGFTLKIKPSPIIHRDEDDNK